MSNHNIYKAPESELEKVVCSSAITKFKRFSAWGVVGLSFITFGFYPAYWLVTRAYINNEFNEQTISLTLIISFFISLLISTALSVASEFTNGNEAIFMIDALAALIYIVLYIVLLVTLRNRLQTVAGSSMNAVLTILLNAIYLQYKINQAIDNKLSEKSTNENQIEN